jgi:signal transduction histidine kinase
MLEPPPWWTLARLLWVLGIMSLVLLAGLLWVFVLNNRVRRQTRIIEEKVKREGILEERNRIAREFHDTLEQELAAVTIQLDAVAAEFGRSPEAARRQLELARNMSRRSHSEARRSVWDMRSHLLESGDLSSALAAMAASVSPTSRARIAVECTGTPRRLAAVTEHHLLRIAQEAVANALKHSGANYVKVALAYAPAKVELLLQDDGRGFDPRVVKGPDNGHFGLLDMQERAEKIGARFSLASLPEQGTEIRVTVADGMGG